MKKTLQLPLLALLTMSLFVFGKTFAQDTTSGLISEPTDVVVESVAADATDSIEDTTTVVESEVILDEEVKASVPSSFGMFWRSFKENVSLTFTFNPVKKAEKRIAFAQENIVTANYILENSTDEKSQEKAQKMFEHANSFIEKAQEKKEFFEQNPDEAKARMLQNLATLEVNSQKLLTKMEGKFPVEKLERLAELETKINERQERFLSGFLNNPNIPEEVKQNMVEIKAEIATKQEERMQEKELHKDLIEKAKSGDEQAKKELKNIRDTKMEENRDEIEDFKEQKKTFIEGRKEQGLEERKLEKEQGLEERKANLDVKMEEKKLEKEQGLEERKPDLGVKMEERKLEKEQGLEERKANLDVKMEERKLEKEQGLEERKPELGVKMEERKLDKKQGLEERKTELEPKRLEMRNEIEPRK